MKRLIAVPLIVATALALAATSLALAAGKAKHTTGTVWAGVTHVEGKNIFVSGDFKDGVYTFSYSGTFK